MGKLLKFLHERLQMMNRIPSEYTSEPPDDIDRFSSLPEEIRLLALSYLRTKEVMQTRVLSKTWKNTSDSRPILFFNFTEFLFDNGIEDPSDEIIREYEAKFAKFVEGVLQKRKASDALSHFVIVSRGENCVSCNSEAFKDCILHALEFKPQLLAVCFCKHKLPSSYEIFACASLEEVSYGSKIEDRDIVIAPDSVNLPRLKILYLCDVTVNDDFLNKFFLGCPIIEVLFLDSCILTASRISTGTLKRLGLLSCDFSRSGPELLTSLSKFTRLTLTVPGSEVKGLFEKGGVPQWPIFKNLKRLKLGGWCLNSDFSLVSFFLQSPNLEQLTLHGEDTEEFAFDDKSKWEELKVGRSQREQLEKVNIRKQGRSNEWIDQLKKNLHAHVKTIGEINVL